MIVILSVINFINMRIEKHIVKLFRDCKNAKRRLAEYSQQMFYKKRCEARLKLFENNNRDREYLMGSIGFDSNERLIEKYHIY